MKTLLGVGLKCKTSSSGKKKENCRLQYRTWFETLQVRFKSRNLHVKKCMWLLLVENQHYMHIKRLFIQFKCETSVLHFKCKHSQMVSRQSSTSHIFTNETARNVEYHRQNWQKAYKFDLSFLFCWPRMIRVYRQSMSNSYLTHWQPWLLKLPASGSIAISNPIGCFSQFQHRVKLVVATSSYLTNSPNIVSLFSLT